MGITSCWILKNAIIRINKYMFLIFLETHCHSICFFSLLSLKFRTMMGLFINMKCIGNFFHAFSSQMWMNVSQPAHVLTSPTQIASISWELTNVSAKLDSNPHLQAVKVCLSKRLFENFKPKSQNSLRPHNITVSLWQARNQLLQILQRALSNFQFGKWELFTNS